MKDTSSVKSYQAASDLTNMACSKRGKQSCIDGWTLTFRWMSCMLVLLARPFHFCDTKWSERSMQSHLGDIPWHPAKEDLRAVCRRHLAQSRLELSEPSTMCNNRRGRRNCKKKECKEKWSYIEAELWWLWKRPKNAIICKEKSASSSCVFAVFVMSTQACVNWWSPPSPSETPCTEFHCVFTESATCVQRYSAIMKTHVLQFVSSHRTWSESAGEV